MIYRCKKEDCGCIVEQDEALAACPQCGGMMEKTEEGELNGREWTVLGNFWLEKGGQEADARGLFCYRQAAARGSLWGHLQPGRLHGTGNRDEAGAEAGLLAL